MRQIHTFPNTGEAYNQSQYRDDIHDGDILVIPSEGVVGFLLAAWPVAVVTDLHGPGELHQFTKQFWNSDDAVTYRDSIADCVTVSEMQRQVRDAFGSFRY